MIDLDAHLVSVYRYHFWDAASQRLIAASQMATAEAIARGLGTAILDSAIRVPRRYVTEAGIYEPAQVSSARLPAQEGATSGVRAPVGQFLQT